MINAVQRWPHTRHLCTLPSLPFRSLRTSNLSLLSPLLPLPRPLRVLSHTVCIKQVCFLRPPSNFVQHPRLQRPYSFVLRCCRFHFWGDHLLRRPVCNASLGTCMAHLRHDQICTYDLVNTYCKHIPPREKAMCAINIHFHFQKMHLTL